MKVVVLFGLLGAVLGHLYYTEEDHLPSLHETQRAFIRVDINKDGTLVLDEMLYYFSKVDSNGDGFVTLKEYEDFLPEDSAEARVHGTFTYFDKLDGDEDNKVTHDAYKKYFYNLDLNGNGKIPFEEFMQTYPLIKYNMEKEILVFTIGSRKCFSEKGRNISSFLQSGDDVVLEYGACGWKIKNV